MPQVPFTPSAFFDVFEAYHRAVWPALFFLYASGLAAIVGAIRGGRVWTRRSLFALTFLWTWMGIVYHWFFFTRINPAAYVFGAMCVLQAVLMTVSALRPAPWRFRFDGGVRSWLGITLLAYALLVYPILGYAMGHRFPRSPTFGLPCPTTILTIGVLMFVRPRAPIALLAIPWIWSLIATPAAYQFGVWEDLGLLAAGVVSAAVWLRSPRDGHEEAHAETSEGAGSGRHTPANLTGKPPVSSGPPGNA